MKRFDVKLGPLLKAWVETRQGSANALLVAAAEDFCAKYGANSKKVLSVCPGKAADSTTTQK